MTTLTLTELSKAYDPDVPVVSEIHLHLHEGELMVLLGPSGGGKTTLLRIIAGLIPPTTGDVAFDGASVLHLPPEKRGIGMVFQQVSLFPFYTVGENVAFGLRMKKLSGEVVKRRVAEALDAVQMTGYENRRPDQLSGGQRQRAALARALVIRPRLLLLDEPLNNLDQELRIQLREMIRRLQKKAGTTTLFVTHDQGEAVAIGDRIALLVEGQIRQVGAPRDFFERPSDLRVARFFGAKNLIQGVKHGDLVHTAIGLFRVRTSSRRDGPVTLMIRPEAMEIGPNGENELQALVRSVHYRGSLVQYDLEVDGTSLCLTAPPTREYPVGQRLAVHVPQERIWALEASPETG